jgi:hypothetical protein
MSDEQNAPEGATADLEKMRRRLENKIKVFSVSLGHAKPADRNSGHRPH